MKTLWIIFVLLFTFYGCRNLRQAEVSNPSERNLLKEIQRVKPSTFRIYASASYDTYAFDPSENIRSHDLNKIEDGSKTIICGYPSGYNMVTRATISKQTQTNKIILDASFNQGFSGAPFFVADESGKLMLAGIVTATASTAKNIIVPEFPNHKKQYNPSEPYKGDIFAEADERIRYGITFTLNSEEIKDFYIENIHQFNNKGISLHRVFNIKDL